MTRMKVSVIVPIYNVEKYISACARSLFEQTFKDVEYIFVNDCATDHSLEILKDVAAHYALPHCQFISHEHNRGSGAARLTGMEHAGGDFVMFVERKMPSLTDSCPSKARTSSRDSSSGTPFRIMSGDG